MYAQQFGAANMDGKAVDCFRRHWTKQISRAGTGPYDSREIIARAFAGKVVTHDNDPSFDFQTRALATGQLVKGLIATGLIATGLTDVLFLEDPSGAKFRVSQTPQRTDASSVTAHSNT
jgi:hypothetical protein